MYLFEKIDVRLARNFTLPLGEKDTRLAILFAVKFYYREPQFNEFEKSHDRELKYNFY